MPDLHISTFNIHKGHSSRRGPTVHVLRTELQRLASDVVFLQEVQGLSLHRSRRYPTWPTAPQYEFLADTLWSEFAYGRNAVYDDGHHGNAVLSKYPILRFENINVSQSRHEQRGLLHCEIEIPGWPEALHCINVHFGLFQNWRQRQITQLCGRVADLVPTTAPLIVAGDFNDWNQQASHRLAGELGLIEVFEQTTGRAARSFPAGLPLLPLDRIYTRGFRVASAQVHLGPHAARLSDHVALSATLSRTA